MNSDEYHVPDHDDTQPDTCIFCGESWDRHEHSCPQSDEDDPVYLQLKEPWTDTP